LAGNSLERKKKMTAQHRREEIQKRLDNAQGPLSASALAAQLGVSRQIVVGDIALLRAAGAQIIATPRGYQKGSTGVRILVACCHDGGEGLRRELYAVVDNGGVVEDVIVENPLYGEITGRLHITSRYDADIFVEKAARQPDCLLSSMTGGAHLHTIICPDEETGARIREQLAGQGLLYENKGGAR